MAKKTKLPNFWQLYHNKKGELTFHLLNGNNRKKLIGATEGYKNQQTCLELLDNVNYTLWDIKYYSPVESLKGEGVCVRIFYELGRHVIRSVEDPIRADRIFIPTPSRVILIRGRMKGVKKK